MKHALNITTTLILCGSMAQAYAQSPAACIATPSCTTLGYTSTTSCTDGLKCPFGEAWNCTHINKITELTNKITELEKTITEKSNNATKSCGIGNIFYSDWTCSIELDSSKTPIGVVVYDDGLGHGQVMALKSIGSYQWGGYGTDIPTLQNYTDNSTAQNDISSCANSAKIIRTGDKSKYPAVWAANEYSTEGTNAGDWCLPAAGIFTHIYNNENTINTGFSRAGGTQFTTNTRAWSSNEYNSNSAWRSYFSGEFYISTDYKGYSSVTGFNQVFPVLTF